MTESKQKLYRVDIRIKYLACKDASLSYSYPDIYDWMKFNFNISDLEEDDFDIVEVTSKEQVDDFDMAYGIYDCDDEMVLESYIEKHGLDLSAMIKKLENFGYSVKKKK